ncbi:J domain-containing protein [Desulforhabdus sp. TSK]|uniref:J domain-containing protein n=1 Tax=Desulforhabdus sp. TSK TaxID=2925014 RepID=UPI001FC7EE32|nr:J domain-containing protein [Desulforhabdus sp. TSK]GKT08874.1 hypothetical protein DSTSK_21790 [Desulforhabdus sp. TSK]
MNNAPARSTYKLIENELDHYEVLLVERNATGQEIEKAYRHLSRLLEPQLKAGVKSAEEHFQLVRRAYEVLSQVESRSTYDLESLEGKGKAPKISSEKRTASTLANWFHGGIWRPRLIAAAFMAVGFAVVSYFGDLLFEPGKGSSSLNAVGAHSSAPMQLGAAAPTPTGNEKPQSLLASAEKILAFPSPQMEELHPPTSKTPDRTATEKPQGGARGDAPLDLLESHPKVDRELLQSSAPQSPEKPAEKPLQPTMGREKAAEKDQGLKDAGMKKGLIQSKPSGNARIAEACGIAAASKSSDPPAAVLQAPPGAPASSEAGQQTKPALPPEPQEKIAAFLDRYTRAYESKDLDALKSFFTADAEENGEPFLQQLPSYRESFKKARKIKYDIQNIQSRTTDEGIEVSGRFSLETGDSGRGKKGFQGPIRFFLTRYHDDYRVRKLDYHTETTQEAKAEPRPPVSRAARAESSQAAREDTTAEVQSHVEPAQKDVPNLREVQAFLNRYTRVYEQRNLKALEGLFEGDALENGESFAALRSVYQSNFQKAEKLRYSVKVLSLTPAAGESADVKGRFVLESVQEDKTHTESAGALHLVLTRHGETYRIRSLDYHVESSREWTDTGS